MIKKIQVNKTEIGERLDIFLQKKVGDFSRNQIQEAIKNGAILVNGIAEKSSYKTRQDDKISLDAKYFTVLSKPVELIDEKIALKVLFEDEYILVIDKSAGMVVHPAHGNFSGTLVNALLDYTPEIVKSRMDNSAYASTRPGIVHRLDKDTSGIIVVAKNPQSLSQLSKQLSEKQIEKNYIALVFGDTAKSGEIKSYLGRDNNNRKKITVTNAISGKLAVTKFLKIQKYTFNSNELSLLSITIPTGRTHQIRVQMKSIGHPIIGDQTYFTKDSKNLSDIIGLKRQFLHANKIKFSHPTNHKSMEIESELPADLQSIIDKLM